jgi:WSC domain
MPEFQASKNPRCRLIHVYQADHFRLCYCGNSLDATAGLTKYPESDCNTPCPGDPSETCGGNFIAEMPRRRQSIILLTTYNNTLNINAAAPLSSSVPLSSTLMSANTTSISSFSSPPTAVSSSTISLSTGIPPSFIAILSASGPSLTGAPSTGGIPTTFVGPVGGSHFFDPGTSSTPLPTSLSGSSTPNSSIQDIPIIISSKC